MATRKYDVCVARKGKDDKTYWTKVGVILKSDKGYSLKLEVVPVGWDGWASLFEPKEPQQRPQQAQPSDGGASTMEDDIPWN